LEYASIATFGGIYFLRKLSVTKSMQNSIDAILLPN